MGHGSLFLSFIRQGIDFNYQKKMIEVENLTHAQQSTQSQWEQATNQDLGIRSLMPLRLLPPYVIEARESRERS